MLRTELPPLDDFETLLYQSRLVLPIVLLTALWLWETLHPLFRWPPGRWRHALHNIALAVTNAVVLGLLFGTATVLVAQRTEQAGYGLLNLVELPAAVRFVLAIVLLDAWMYGWHRANHAIPLLWRFHRMHHSDNRMDVTSATRFHTGELAAANLLRLALIPLLGLQIAPIVCYEIMVVAVTQFHHANISLGRYDRWLRAVIVTPDMHKLHHSRWRPETDSNFSTVFSCWDRLARSFRMRPDPGTVEFGLDDYDDSRWQTMWGMLKTPFTSPRPPRQEETAAPPKPAARPRAEVLDSFAMLDGKHSK